MSTFVIYVKLNYKNVKSKTTIASRVYFFIQITSTAVVNPIHSIILKSENIYIDT